MNTCYLLLGGNMGQRFLMLKSALRYIENKIGNIIAQSSVYETAAWGKHDQPAFLNKVIMVETELKPKELLHTVLEIEKSMGRNRAGEKWEERIIDIDILFYNNEVIKEDNLTIPHPYLHERMFTLVPLSEIAPGYIHPVLNKKIAQLRDECQDQLKVNAVTDRE